jgi:hypothetical protein
MKRGLVVADTAERAERVAALQASLRRAGLAAALVYGDVSRSDDIAYLTNLCIYWNEGVLAVPAEGEPAFITRLSKRVQPWMRATSTLTDIRSGPDVAGGIAGFVRSLPGAGGSAGALREPAGAVAAANAAGALRVGLVDAGWWPAMLLAEIERAVPEADLVPLDYGVRELRLVPSPYELAVLREAGAALSAAIDAALAAPHPLAALERAARRAGFTDVLARTGDGWIDATGQYRTLWIRAARATDASLALRLTTAAGGLRDGARPPVRCISHADLATDGDHRLGEAEPLRAGEVVTLLVDDGGVAAETYVVTESEPECLTRP